MKGAAIYGERSLFHHFAEPRMAVTDAHNPAPLPRFETGTGFHRVSGHELEDLLTDLHANHGEDNFVVITRSNKRAVQFNQQIRARLLWMSRPCPGQL